MENETKFGGRIKEREESKMKKSRINQKGQKILSTVYEHEKLDICLASF